MPYYKEDVVKLIYVAIDEVNKILPKEQRLEKGANTVFFGDDGRLDSLGLISFIGIAEREIEKKYGKVIALADEKAMDPKTSPFRNVDTLAEHIMSII